MPFGFSSPKTRTGSADRLNCDGYDADTNDFALAAFAGSWTTRHGKRGTKSNPIEGEALKLQRPRPDGALKIVATGEKEDQAVA
jgi:hypothetical protein